MNLGSPSDRIDCGDIVYVPAGKYTMRISHRRAAAWAARYNVHETIFGLETPERKVYVGAFLIDRYPVTNGEYAAFLRKSGHKPPYGWESDTCPPGRENLPVTGVGWDDAVAYAGWAGKRLPTEEEWEKAARGTDGRLYPWGNEWIPGACHSDGATHPGDPFGPVPVGNRPQDVSPYGALDMGGNVTEWTATEAQNAIPWTGFYLVKGGSFVLSQPYSFRCSGRAARPPGNTNIGYIGFRCAMGPTGDPTQTGGSSQAAAHKSRVSSVLPRPRPGLYLKEPIRLAPVQGSNLVGIEVPYLPGNKFSLQVLENLPMDRGEGGFERQNGCSRSIAVFHWAGVPDSMGRLEAEVGLQGEPDYVSVS